MPDVQRFWCKTFSFLDGKGYGDRHAIFRIYRISRSGGIPPPIQAGRAISTGNLVDVVHLLDRATRVQIHCLAASMLRKESDSVSLPCQNNWKEDVAQIAASLFCRQHFMRNTSVYSDIAKHKFVNANKWWCSNPTKSNNVVTFSSSL